MKRTKDIFKKIIGYLNRAKEWIEKISDIIISFLKIKKKKFFKKVEDILTPESGRSFIHIHSYVISEFLLSFFICFLFFFVVFVANQVLLMAEKLLKYKVPLIDVLKLLFYGLPWVITMSFPFATLVGALMCFGRLSSDNEIIAMRTSGLSNHRIFAPILVIGILFSLFSFGINDYLLPLGAINFNKHFNTLTRSNPEMILQSDSIIRYEDTTIITGKVEKGQIGNILIIRTENNKKEIIQSSHAVLKDVYSQGIISIELYNVTGHTFNYRNRDTYDYFTAEKMLYNILIADVSNSINQLDPKQMRSKDVKAEINKMEALHNKSREIQLSNARRAGFAVSSFYRDLIDNPSQAQDSVLAIRNKYEVIRQSNNFPKTTHQLKNWTLEYYQKYAIPFSCFPFILLAFPIGIMARKNGRSVGFGIGLLIAVLYWFELVLGRSLGTRSGFAPLPVIWFPNVLLLLIGVVLYYKSFKK